MSEPVRIAMWSGPRNISTALMRAWGNRQDTIVCDEPFYAFYLQRTGLKHPGAAEVIEHHETDWRRVVSWLTGPIPPGRQVFYQKQMTHHLLPEIEREWFSQVTHCFLIRQPREMITSLLKFLPEPDLSDTGWPQQVEIFDWVCRRWGTAPPVIDARDVLENPRRVLSSLCDALGLPFDDAMLSWPAGPRDTDGVWAKYWYQQVNTTRGFGRYEPKNEAVPAALTDLCQQCEEFYHTLYRHRIV